jgi:hypothetical protein
MQTHKSYHPYLIKPLEDPAEAAAYLDAVFEDDDFDHILLALKNVAEARRALMTASSSFDANWETCYQLIPNPICIPPVCRGIAVQCSLRGIGFESGLCDSDLVLDKEKTCKKVGVANYGNRLADVPLVYSNLPSLDSSCRNFPNR